MTQRRADLGLVGLTVVWGTTFTFVHEAVAQYPPLAFLALRFGIASVALAPVLLRRRGEWASHARAGLLLGALLFGGFATQTIGLRHTTPARAGFITGLSVALVPVVARLVGQRLRRQALAGVAVAVIGLAIVSFGCEWLPLHCGITASGTTRHVVGDAWVGACALLFALHIVGVSHFSASLRPVTLNAIQLGAVAGLAVLASLAFERPVPLPPREVATAALFLGLVASALVLALWLHLQRYTNATHAALIFTLEPVFAAAFSWAWSGEVITPAIWLGGAVMILGVLTAELPIPEKLEGFPPLRWLNDDPLAR